jgi:hypothetical protein
MLRIWLMAMLAAAFLSVGRNHDVLHRSGFVGHCTTSQAPVGASGVWRSCEKGVLGGRPNLTDESCSPRGKTGSVEIWRCPTTVQAAPVG